MIRFKLLWGYVGFVFAGQYEGDVVLEALPESEDHILYMHQLDKQYSLDFWYPESVGRLQPDENFQVHVLAEEKYDVVKGLMDAGMMFRIMHRNLDKMIDVSYDQFGSSGNFFDRGEVEIYNYNVYHEMDDIYRWSDKMAENTANRITKKSIGKTWEGRDLFVFVFDEPSGIENPPKIFMDCGIHAREWISPAFCQYFVDQLANPDSKFGHLRTGIEWHIMPVVNPDGYAHSWASDRFWRKNRNPNTGQETKDAQKKSGAHNKDCGVGKGVGVDLNRNYDAKWQLGDQMIGSSKWCKDQSYQGARVFSEPESQAHSDYMLSINPKAYLTIHSYAQVVLFPYTWSRDAARPHNYEELIGLSTEITKRIGGNWRHGQGRDIFYPAAGGSDDWAHSTGVDIVYTFELRDKGNYGFMLPEFLIRPAVEEAARGISAVYDHLRPQNIENNNGGDGGGGHVEPEPEVEKKTQCEQDPEEVYIGTRTLGDDFTPTFTCAFKSGKCKVKCPKGTMPKLKKAGCKNDVWKPSPAKFSKQALCVEGLSAEKHADYSVHCSKLNFELTNEQVANVGKDCVVAPTGKRMKCVLSCDKTRNEVENVIKLGKKGVSAGSKKFLWPACALIQQCV